MPYGSLYYGSLGFLYKTAGGGGNSRVITGDLYSQYNNLNNRYVSGSGVGASTISNRRVLKNRSSTTCNCKNGVSI